MLGVMLPLYPMLFVIYQKIGKYDEIVEEFKKLRSEHEQHKENWHGNRNENNTGCEGDRPLPGQVRRT
jgi:hypothetical protein